MHKTLGLLFAGLLGVLVAPSASQAQSYGNPLADPGSFRLLVDFDAGFGGTGKVSAEGESATFDLGTTLGMRLQGMLPIADILYAGFGFGLDGYIGENASDDADRLLMYGFEGLFGVQIPIDLGSMVLEPTAGVSLGLALATANDVDFEDSELGLAFGFRVGANLWFTRNVGVNLRMGYQMHALWPDFDPDVSVRYTLQQFRFGLGGIFRF
tara:strand:+ start:247 stop:879 length:633 start_codon:yes stop_codon:yes gene_type:complete